MNFEKTLEKICSDRRLESHWVNLLSLLEYIGCRKILKGVPFNEVNAEILRHVFEESLHAFTLKKLVDTPWSEGLFTQIGWNYFKSLDEEISSKVQPSYRAVSWAIEERVMRVYPLYVEKTDWSETKQVLCIILAQERRHAEMFLQEERADLKQIEEKLWENFCLAISAIVESAPLADSVREKPNMKRPTQAVSNF